MICFIFPVQLNLPPLLHKTHYYVHPTTIQVKLYFDKYFDLITNIHLLGYGTLNFWILVVYQSFYTHSLITLTSQYQHRYPLKQPTLPFYLTPSHHPKLSNYSHR